MSRISPEEQEMQMGATAILERSIRSGQALVSIVGQGYVGLPLAISIARAGYPTYGIDVDLDRVQSLADGNSHIIDVPDSELKEVLHSGLYQPTTEFDVISKSDVVIMCVPTPLAKSKNPDVSYIINAMDMIKLHLHKNILVVLESTTYPGTTEELIAAEVENCGFTVGRDIFVCFSPERVDPGNKSFKTANTPKIVGGITANCTTMGSLFYDQIIETVVPVSSAKTAEMVKLLENIFRAVNIALVNELAMICERMEISIWDVVDAASTKPFGFVPFYPGPGIGGHCIPLDPMYLSWKAKMFGFYSRFIDLASDVNENMPRHVVTQVAEVLNLRRKSLNGSKILLLGITYKRDIDDLRESPSLHMYRLFASRGASVDFHDPYVKNFVEAGQTIRAVNLSERTLAKYDCVVLATDHTAFDYDWIARYSELIFDTRNAFKDNTSPHIFRLGAPLPTRSVTVEDVNGWWQEAAVSRDDRNGTTVD